MEIFITAPIPTSLVFFSTYSSKFLMFFSLHLSHSSNVMYFRETFTNSILLMHLSHRIPLVSHKLLVNLSMLDAINLQLPISLSLILLHTFVLSLLVITARLMLMLLLSLFRIAGGGGIGGWGSKRSPS